MPLFPRLTRPFKHAAHRYAGHPARVFLFCLKFGFFTHVFFEYAFSLAPTQGASMLPTFEVIGDYVLISRHYRRGRDVRVGDIVSFDSVVQPGEKVIKRVLGMEGDYVLRNTPGVSDNMIQERFRVSCGIHH